MSLGDNPVRHEWISIDTPRLVLSILSPSTLLRDMTEAVHPVFQREKYRGRVRNIEVNAEALNGYLKSSYGIGILRR